MALDQSLKSRSSHLKLGERRYKSETPIVLLGRIGPTRPNLEMTQDDLAESTESSLSRADSSPVIDAG